IEIHLAGQYVPKQDRPVPAAGDKGFAVRGERQRHDPGDLDDLIREWLARFDVPDLKVSVSGTGGEQGGIRGESDHIDPRRVACKPERSLGLVRAELP